MIPGKTYVGILPGHTRPAFIRKRPVDAGKPPLLLTQIFGSSQRGYSVEAPRKPSMFCRSRSRSDVYYDYATAKYRPKVYVEPSPGRTITSVQQTCASCGKFRSARWQSRHPLISGTRPGLCGKCRDKHTSSEEEIPQHHRKRHHHRRRVCTESTDDSRDTSEEPRRSRRRHRSHSRDYRRRSLAKSPSTEKVRIIIANQAGDRIRPGRERTRSSSVEPVRVIRRTEVVDLPDRPPGVRSILRSSSHSAYVDSDTQYIEGFDPPRYLPKPRTISRVSYIEDVEQPRCHSRPRGSSHVSYVEELERPRYRSRPQSWSRVSYVERSKVPRSRRRTRSSSQVRFVDEIDEPVSSPKQRRLKRRRVVYFDGPADTERSEQAINSPAPSTYRVSQGAANGDGDAVLIQEMITQHCPVSGQGLQHARGAELIEEQTIPNRRSSSRSHENFVSVSGTVSNPPSRQPSKATSYVSESDDEATPRPAFRQAQVMQSPDDVEEPPSHHSSYVEFEGARTGRRSHSPAFQSRKPSLQYLFTKPETPSSGERECIRDADESSGPGDDCFPRRIPTSYRHVEAPEPPTSRTDFLVEMLKKTSFTRPSAQHARGRPLHRNHYSESDTPSPPYYQPSYPSEDGCTGYEGRYMTGETLRGDSSLREPDSRSNAEYNWMT